MKLSRLSIYVTATHSSVTVQNGASRETSARTTTEMIDAMPEADRAVLAAFCRATVAYIDGTNQTDGGKALAALIAR